jgi:hypothetical protein
VKYTCGVLSVRWKPKELYRRQGFNSRTATRTRPKAIALHWRCYVQVKDRMQVWRSKENGGGVVFGGVGRGRPVAALRLGVSFDFGGRVVGVDVVGRGGRATVSRAATEQRRVEPLLTNTHSPLHGQTIILVDQFGIVRFSQ